MGVSVARRRRLGLAKRVRGRLRAGTAPSPPAAGLSDAVSLRVQPQLVLALRAALARAPGIKTAFVYGSAAAEGERRASAIDLMVIGDASHADCFTGLFAAENALERPIQARFVSAAEWKRKLARK